MADLATYNSVSPVTIKVGAAAVARGVRVLLGSDGTVSAASAAARGQYVTLREGAIGEAIPGVAAGTPAKVPALASEAVDVGDPAYSAANGKFSQTATDAVYMGVWTMAASGDGVLGEVQLASVA